MTHQEDASEDASMKLVLTAILCLLIAACSTPSANQASQKPIQTQVSGDWPNYANDPGSSKYSALSQINKDTVKDLKLAWVWESADQALIAKNSKMMALGFKSTPIKIDDVLYISTSLGQVAAIDAATGKERWVFDTKTYEIGRPTNLGFNHRGVAYWSDGKQQRILMPTNNAYLWSLDAVTGKADLSFGENGRVDLTQGLGRPVDRKHYSVISAPMIVGDTVIVGSSIWDRPKNKQAPPGHVRGFDVKTGEQTWIFHSIPQAGEAGNETWENDSWKYTGNANVWTVMSADLELGYVYLPFGTPTNDYYGGHRLGDNKYAESLVCLNAVTGELVWHFQMVHHGLWDYDLPAAPNLVDITVDGKAIKAVAQISKQAFVYVFDRITGEPVWPIEERPVPASNVPGERAALTQPFPTRPAPFDLQGISDNTLIDFTPELRAEALELISQYTYGEIFTPPTMNGTIQLPGHGGGANWSGAAFDPETSMFYIPSHTAPIIAKLVEAEDSDMRYTVSRIGRVRGPQRLPITKPPYTRISAINLDTGEYTWVKPNGEGMRQQIIDMGLPDPGPVGARRSSGPLLTKSLLFIAIRDEKPVLRALDKQTGELVHQLELPANPAGTPMTYMVDGKQYISLAIGSRADAKLVTYALTVNN